MAQALPQLPAIVRRESGDESPAIVCEPIFDELCVNANGDIVCSSCDVNGQRVYGNVFRDRISDIYNGPMYQEMREWLLRSRPDNWCPAITRQCPRRATPATAEHKKIDRRVKVLKLEPVTYCNLECPACPVELQFKENAFLRQTRGHKLLPLETMLDVVAQLPDLEWILYFNFGEPFLHKDTVPFLREARRTRPTVRIATNTNGLVLTPAQIKAIAEESLMDRIIFSIDGATQDSYQRYRVGGTFSKAFGKMKALVEACQAAGTWRQYGIEPPGGVNIAWQYILFEWNDSDEELAKAQELAKSIGVPIVWVITCGYGASKRFLAGSAEAARLMSGSASFVHMAAPAELATRIEGKGLSAFDFDAYKKIEVTCELLSLPYDDNKEEEALPSFFRAFRRKLIRASRNKQDTPYRARLLSADSSIVAPTGAIILFQIDVQNRTNKGWDLKRSDFLRLGVRLRVSGEGSIVELPGAILPSTTAKPLGRDTVALRAVVPSQPGRYELMIDVVQEWVCWFSDCGSSHLTFSVQVE